MSSSKFIQPLAVVNDAFSPLFRKGIGTEAITAYNEAMLLGEDQLHPRIAKHKIPSLRRMLLDSKLVQLSRRFRRSGVRARIETTANGVPYVVIQSGSVLLIPCQFGEREFKTQNLPEHLVNLMRRSIASSKQMSLFDRVFDIDDHLLCLLGHGAESHTAGRPSFLDVVIPDQHGEIIDRMSLLPGRKKRRRPIEEPGSQRQQPTQASEIDLPLKPEAKRRRDRRKGEEHA